MTSRFRLAAASVAVVMMTGAVGWVLVPDKATSWVFVIAFPLGLWAFLELSSTGTSEAATAIRNHHRVMVAVLCLFILADVGPDLAISRGVLGAEWDLIARRSRGLLTGATLMFWGNHLPKVMSPWSVETEPFDWQGVHRFVGTVFTLAGVALVVVWATLPAAEANRAAVLIGASVVAMGLGRKLLSVLRYSQRGRAPVR
jgi:hypothetical protein